MELLSCITKPLHTADLILHLGNKVDQILRLQATRFISMWLFGQTSQTRANNSVDPCATQHM